MAYEEAQKALNKAKIALMGDAKSVFYTHVCFSLIHEWDLTIPTAAVDGVTMFFNPDYLLKLQPGERVSMLLHETKHVALDHISRIKNREHDRWNRAGDYVINGMLAEQGYPVPSSWLYDPAFANMSTEQVYEKLQGSASPASYQMDIRPHPKDTNTAKNELDAILVRAAMQAEMSGKGIGNLPEELQIYLKELRDPVLPWPRILRSFITKLSKLDYSFRKPNRRYFPDHILPSQYSESLCDIAVAIDTSGSISDKEFNDFMSEVSGIIKKMKPEKTTLLQFDTRIKAIDTLSNVADVGKVSFTGRGGTNITEVIEWTAKNKPAVMIIFTDGEFRMPQLKPKVPVIWVIHGNARFHAPYGKTIKYTFKRK